VGSVGVALVLALAPSAAVAKDKETAIEAWSGHYINPNPGSVEGMSFVDIEIYRWTTDEERQALAQTLASKGSDALVQSMRDDKSRVGWVRLPGTVSYDLKYARAFDTDKGRQIVLATDRPVSMAEVRYDSRTLDYGLTLIAFVMPTGGGDGEGSILAGAELELDDSGQLTIESVSFEPLRFDGVKAKPVKKK
jgi:hypothetical protein